MAGAILDELDDNSEYSQHAPADIRTELKLVNHQANLICREPPSTPACVGYANLLASSQYQKNNFYPRKRPFLKTLSAQENEAALLRHLNKYWGHDSFRGPQLDICGRVMRGDDVIAVMPTGLGKSVCFQVPAVTLEYGITIVLSPLLALMQDQVSSLKSKGIKAEMLYHESSDAHVKYVRTQLGMGHPEIRLLYLTPETLFGPKIKDAIRKAYSQKQLIRLVIDEAHVIQEWGTTFRPVYRELGQFREEFKDVPISAFTASAAADTREYIRDTLGMRPGHYAQWVEPFNRKNLFYEVRYLNNPRQDEQVENVANFITAYRKEAHERNKTNQVTSRTVSGLVYCRRRATCEEVAEDLTKRGIKAQVFHAGLDDHKKAAVLDLWRKGALECIVATIAFGMGVDQAHVRYVIHFDMPKTFEGFYQETGRAGRDGHISRCILYYSREDARYLRSQAGDVSSDSNAKTRMSEEETELHKMRMLNSFKAVTHFAEDDSTCRHVAICRYFGEVIDATKEEVLTAYCNKMCDVCVAPSTVRRRARNLTEEIDICSQAVRPITQRRFADRQGDLDIVVEGTQEEDDDLQSLPGTLGSLGQLHGSAAHMPSDPMDEEDLFPRPRVAVQATQPTEPRSQGKASSKPIVVRSSQAASTPSQGDIVSQREDWMDWPESGSGGLVKGSDSRRHPSKGVAPSPSLPAPESGKSKSSQDDAVTQQTNRAASSQASRGPAFGQGSKRTRPADLTGPSDRPSGPPRRIPHTSTTGVRAPLPHAGPVSKPDVFQTPCPPPRSRPGSKFVRTGPTSLLNSSRPNRPAMTMDMIDAGDYAVADAGPSDPEARKRQKDAFKAVTPITGRGPYSYYTNTAPPMTGRKRKLSAAQEQGSSFRTPFKVPLVPERERLDPGAGKTMISIEDRQLALAEIKDALKKSLIGGSEAGRLWRCWGWKGTWKTGVRDGAVELESVIVNQSHTPAVLRDQTAKLVQAIRLLRVTEGADIIVKGILDDFEGDEYAKWLVVLDGVMRGLSRDS